MAHNNDDVVFRGDTMGGRWRYRLLPKNEGGHAVCSPPLVELTLDEAAAEVAEHFNCTLQNARDSLLRNRYASCITGLKSTIHWHMKGPGVEGTVEDRW